MNPQPVFGTKSKVAPGRWRAHGRGNMKRRAQGCYISPILFNLYGERLAKEAVEEGGIY